MGMKESLIGHTWIICSESDCGPAAGGDTDRIPFRGIDQVIFQRVSDGIEVTNSSADHEEIVAMEMKRMRLNRQHIGVLQHQLNRRIKRHLTQPRP